MEDLRTACDARQILLGVWEPEPNPGSAQPTVDTYDADFYLAQAEAPNDWVAIAEQALSVPKAIVTTLFGQDVQSTNALVQHGWKCLTECYISENPNATPDRMDFEARKLGWKGTQPVFGFQGVGPDPYEKWANWIGHGIWSAEYAF